VVKIQVFDPAMCCTTGVCGPTVDPALPRIAADLDWLAQQGVEVERYNLSQDPAAFIGTAVVRRTLQAEGSACLPLVLRDGEIVRRGSYPERPELVAMAGLSGAALRS